MTTSNSRLAFGDCQDVFEKALNDAKGVRVMFDDYGKAAHFITRMHRFREIDRADNAEEYPKGTPLHGRSVYDQAVVRRPVVERFTDGHAGYWVYVEKMSIDNLVIESLSEGPSLEYQEPKRLEILSGKEAAE